VVGGDVFRKSILGAATHLRVPRAVAATSSLNEIGSGTLIGSSLFSGLVIANVASIG
jgi:hypothetical protein